MDLSVYAQKPASNEFLPLSQERPKHSEELTGSALRLIVTLNRRVSVDALAEDFPRLLNRIADIWHWPSEVRRLFDELLMDERGGRAGFPLKILSEIARLREYHVKLYPQKTDVWAETYWR